MRQAIIGAVGLVVLSGGLSGQQSPEHSRLLEELNWLEAQEVIPQSINTVLVPVGTVEPHGVVHNGADNTVPFELAMRLADRVNGLVAPTIPYGVTVTLDEYAGALGVRAATLEAYSYDVLSALARAGFRNIVVLNGHGPNGEPLRRAAARVFRETDARVLITEWWTLTAELGHDVYGTEGGHAGNNETGAVLAVRPDLVQPERYTGPEMATPRGSGWTAYPFPSSIVLYRAGEGYPDFDGDKAARFFDGVVTELADLIHDVITKWDRAGL